MAKGPLKYDRELYSATTSPLIFTDKEARAEYARLRRLANKRLDVLERAGYGEAASLRNYPASFGSMRGASERDMRKALADVSRFLSLKTTTLRGIKSSQKKAINTLHEHGYDFINKDNIESFGRFMEAAKRHAGSKKAFDSEQAVEAFRAAKAVEMSDEEMEDYLDDWEEMEDYEPDEPDESERVQPAQPATSAKDKTVKKRPKQRASERWKERAQRYASGAGRRGQPKRQRPSERWKERAQRYGSGTTRRGSSRRQKGKRRK